MGIFSGTVRQVEGTRIFARQLGTQEQCLVYQMSLDVRSAVALIVPLPIAPGTHPKQVRFIDLSDARRFFDHLANAFDDPAETAPGGTITGGMSEVQRVGDFEATYVPSFEHFPQLPKRFRLPPVVLENLPHYSDYGFAVFRLRPGLVRRLARMKPQPVQPMAITFPTRAPGRLFFPTLRLYGKPLSKQVAYSHDLYFQGTTEESVGALSSYWPVEVSRPLTHFTEGFSHDLVTAGLVRRVRLTGRHRNMDTWVTPLAPHG